MDTSNENQMHQISCVYRSGLVTLIPCSFYLSIWVKHTKYTWSFQYGLGRKKGQKLAFGASFSQITLATFDAIERNLGNLYAGSLWYKTSLFIGFADFEIFIFGIHCLLFFFLPDGLYIFPWHIILSCFCICFIF